MTAVSYAPSGRLAASTGPWGQETQTYDAAGDRTSDVVTASGATTTHNEIIASTRNWLTSVKDASGTTTRTFTYPAGGSLASDSTVGGAAYTYTYDARKRLSQVLLNGVEAGTYGYDYKDRQAWRSVDGGAQSQYVYDEDDHLLAEYNGATGALVKEYVWLDDLPVAMIDSTSGTAVTYYITAGRLNEPQQLIDSSGTVDWNAYVTPWGTAQTFTTPTETIDLRLPGQWVRPETGNLSQNGFRDYNPSTGRYNEADPTGLAGGANLYSYADNDPMDQVDPTGLGPAGAAVGGEAGATIAGLLGVETGPGEGVIIPAGELVGSVIGSAIQDAVAMAQNNRQVRRRIASLQENIQEHQQKLNNSPNCQDAPHWQQEIKAWTAEINRLRRRLPNGN